MTEYLKKSDVLDLICKHTRTQVVTDIMTNNRFKANIMLADRFTDDFFKLKSKPEIHGHWIRLYNNQRCSQCNGVTLPSMSYKYCPYCSAVMDEVSE